MVTLLAALPLAPLATSVCTSKCHTDKLEFLFTKSQTLQYYSQSKGIFHDNKIFHLFYCVVMYFVWGIIRDSNYYCNLFAHNLFLVHSVLLFASFYFLFQLMIHVVC